MRSALPIAAALVAGACSGTPAPPAGTPAASAQPGREGASAGYFTVPADQLAHVQVVPVARASWPTILHTTGTVDWDNDHTTHVISQVGGPITRILVDTGTRVKAGDVLLYVSSPDVTQALSDYRKASNRLDLARRTLDRDKDLLAHLAISQREFEATEADYNDAGTDLQDALQRLRILGVTAADLKEAEQQNVPIRPELALRAPLGGTVVEKLVLPGQVIEAGSTDAFVITDTSTVWVQGHIYEKDLRSVHRGDRAEMRNPAFPDAFHGTVDYIGAILDPATRTTPVRIVTPNRGGLLKKDLFLDVTITDMTTREPLVVPVTAVLYDEQNFPFVYVQVAAGQFAERQVTVGGQRDDRVEIADGLREGDRVVAQGSLFLQFANSFKG